MEARGKEEEKEEERKKNLETESVGLIALTMSPSSHFSCSLEGVLSILFNAAKTKEERSLALGELLDKKKSIIELCNCKSPA